MQRWKEFNNNLSVGPTENKRATNLGESIWELGVGFFQHQPNLSSAQINEETLCLRIPGQGWFPMPG